MAEVMRTDRCLNPAPLFQPLESIKHKDACCASTGSSVLLIVDFRYTNALRRLAARLFDQECVKSRKRGAFVCDETSLRQESFGQLVLAFCVTVRRPSA